MLIDPLGGPAYWLPFILGFIIAYLIGSIPFGLLITRFAGLGDVRKIGSGNIGATNVLRTGRKDLAAMTFGGDLVKGFLPVFLSWFFFGIDMAVIAGLATVLGHCFPIWLKFQGGKGVATAAGVILALSPLSFVIIIVLFVLIVWITRYVSLGSALAAIAAPVAAWFTSTLQITELFVLLALVVLFQHRANIVRLIKGSENQLTFSKKNTD